jgi:NADH-quinone oxidoreductase subunit K
MSLQIYLILGAFLFTIGVVLVLVKRNVIMILIGIELIFNASNLNLVAFSHWDASQLQGQSMSLFVMVIAAAEAAVALAILVQVYRYFQTANLDEINSLKG